jgi:hypothetical protein
MTLRDYLRSRSWSLEAHDTIAIHVDWLLLLNPVELKLRRIRIWERRWLLIGVLVELVAVWLLLLHHLLLVLETLIARDPVYRCVRPGSLPLPVVVLSEVNGIVVSVLDV